MFTPPEAAAAPRISAAEGMGPLQVRGLPRRASCGLGLSQCGDAAAPQAPTQNAPGTPRCTPAPHPPIPALCPLPSLPLHLQLWGEYCAWQRLPPPAAEAGADLLRGLLGGATTGAPLEQPHTAIEFEAVEVEGYFRQGLTPGEWLVLVLGTAAAPGAGAARRRLALSARASAVPAAPAGARVTTVCSASLQAKLLALRNSTAPITNSPLPSAASAILFGTSWAGGAWWWLLARCMTPRKQASSLRRCRLVHASAGSGQAALGGPGGLTGWSS